MKTTALPLSLLVVLALSAASSARIIDIPEEHQTIQRGIDAAEAGDTVLVQPGVYRESLRITSPITLCSRRLFENNRNDEDRRWIDSTVIEAVDSNRVISISSEQGHVRICGFTIRGGNTPESGGGIRGGITNASLEELTITGCRAGSYGGGLYWAGDCDSLMIRNCIINDNSAGEGGGVSLWIRPNATISDCIIRDNRASNEGALFSHAANVTMRNVLVTGNRSGDWGGVMRLTSCTEGSARIDLDHVTVAGNRLLNEETEDNMIFILANSPDTRMEATVSNCILWGGDYPMIKLMGYLGRCAIDYSDLSRGREGIRNESENIEALIGDNLLDSDPLFVNPDNGDYHLTADSPCIDAGDPASSWDPDGTRADMGAFYFPHNGPPQVAVWILDFSVDEDCGSVVIADLDTIFSDPN